MALAKTSKGRSLSSSQNSGFNSNYGLYVLVFLVMSLCGYGIGWLSRNQVLSHSDHQDNLGDQVLASGSRKELRIPRPGKTGQVKQWPGDSIHSVLTSSGDSYQNFQTRIMYASYKLVQQMPGGERLTGFTRILHRTVPDFLMDEVPTFHAFPKLPECDGWCEYPVANRPYAIKDFFEAAARNASMIQGAWIFMLEADYVWMQPPIPTGDAWIPSTPGLQFWYDYIIPDHPDAVPSIKKLYPGNVKDVPASGPSPVMLRLREWLEVVPTYVQITEKMEADDEIKQKLGWVREMYAWDVALALHKDTITMVTELHTNSSTIVQPPFDEHLGRACLCHYTWGALYHEGLPSKGAKQVYRWEKRDFNDLEKTLKVPNIPMPPEYKDGWILEFDAPLNRKRHDLVVAMLTQMNKAINTLPDLHDTYKAYQTKLPEYQRQRDAKLASKAAAAATKALTTTAR